MDEQPQDAEPDDGGHWEDRGGYRVFVSSPKPAAPAAPAAALAAADPAVVAVRTDPLAVVALVLGLIGVLGLPLGLWAKARIRRSGEAGAGLATAGVVLGSV